MMSSSTAVLRAHTANNIVGYGYQQYVPLRLQSNLTLSPSSRPGQMDLELQMAGQSSKELQGVSGPHSSTEILPQ